MTNVKDPAPVAETAGEAVGVVSGCARANLYTADIPTGTLLYAAPVPAQDDDKLREAGGLFKALHDQSWDLRCFNVPTGGDDFEIGWRVVGHWMAEPRERTMAQVFVDDPAEAVRQALADLKSTAAQEGGSK